MRVTVITMLLFAGTLFSVQKEGLQFPRGHFYSVSKTEIFSVQFLKKKKILIKTRNENKPVVGLVGFFNSPRLQQNKYMLSVMPVSLTTSDWPAKTIPVMSIDIWQEKRFSASVEVMSEDEVKFCIHDKTIGGAPWTECKNLSRNGNKDQKAGQKGRK